MFILWQWLVESTSGHCMAKEGQKPKTSHFARSSASGHNSYLVWHWCYRPNCRCTHCAANSDVSVRQRKFTLTSNHVLISAKHFRIFDPLTSNDLHNFCMNMCFTSEFLKGKAKLLINDWQDWVKSFSADSYISVRRVTHTDNIPLIRQPNTISVGAVTHVKSICQLSIWVKWVYHTKVVFFVEKTRWQKTEELFFICSKTGIYF